MESNNKNHSNFDWAYVQLRHYFIDVAVPANVLEPLLNLFTIQKIKKDSFFSVETETSDKLGFVCTGCFVMFVDRNNDIDVKDFIGQNNLLLSTFLSNKSVASIQALADSIILQAKYSSVKELYKSNPALEEAAQKGMEKRINHICRNLSDLKSLTAMERYTQFKGNYYTLEQHIPQFLIASYLGITPTQLSRIRTKIRQNQQM